MSDVKKFERATLPATRDEAVQMADEREAWAADARKADLHGTAGEWELTAQLLRVYAITLRA
jgi:hypothetical protein